MDVNIGTIRLRMSCVSLFFFFSNFAPNLIWKIKVVVGFPPKVSIFNVWADLGCSMLKLLTKVVRGSEIKWVVMLKTRVGDTFNKFTLYKFLTLMGVKKWHDQYRLHFQLRKQLELLMSSDGVVILKIRIKLSELCLVANVPIGHCFRNF